MKVYYIILVVLITSFLSACDKQTTIVRDGNYTISECHQLSGVMSRDFTGTMTESCLSSGDCHFRYLCPNGTTSIGTVGSGLEGGVCCK